MIDYLIYTDGSCKDTIGGWGYVIYQPHSSFEDCGYELKTTNQRMELLAALKALECFIATNERYTILLITDSKYLIDCMTKWMTNFKKRGWKTQNKLTDVKHRDILEKLAILNMKHNITWKWVKGHSGVEGNALADKLASQGRDLGVSNILAAVNKENVI